MRTLAAMIPWLDRFQRGRGLEGDVIILGLGDGTIPISLADCSQEGERFVVIDPWWTWEGLVMTGAPFRIAPDRDLIIIREDPLDVIGTDAMDLEDGSYRIVSIHATEGVERLLEQASFLIVHGGMVLMSPWPGDQEYAPHIAGEYWDYLHHTTTPLMRCGHEGDTLLMTNDRVWQKDYEAVIAAAKQADLV